MELKKEMELKKQRAQIKRSPLHMAAPCIVSHGDYRSLHQARSPMEPAPPTAVGGYQGVYYGNNYVEPNEIEQYAPQVLYDDYTSQYHHQPGQFQQHASVFQFQHPTTAMSTQAPYSQSCFMYQPSAYMTEPSHELPCGQQGN